MTHDCPFCGIDHSRELLANDHAIAVPDGFPISPGHLLIIPKRHVLSFFSATIQERSDMIALLDAARDRLIKEYKPDGFNIGINDGVAAGQTVMHMHIHLIPRYTGDTPDPRGGVRWIFPDKAAYWRK